MFTRSHQSVSCRPFFPATALRADSFSWRTLLCTGCLLFLLLFTSFVAPWSALQPAVALAAGTHNPNPKIAPPAWLKPLPPKKQPKQGDYRTMLPATLKPVAQQWRVPMTPATLHLTNQAQQFVSNDGQLEVDIAAGTISAAQVKQAGGSLQLTITQVIPASGGLRSTHIFFGTYQFQWHTASGQPVSGVVLAHPLVIQYHLQKQQATLLIKGQEVYALWHTGDVSMLLTGLTPPKVKPTLSLTQKSVPSSSSTSKLLPATGDATGLIWSIASNLSSDMHVHTALSSSTITFGTQAPQANWGSPQDFQVDLNAGGLSYTYPLVIPPGPGGFAPPLNLTYSSGSVNESHNLQAAAPWVGEGWNLSLGSVSWSEENVTLGGTNQLESIWSISDPTGISGQLIPPDVNASTVSPYVPNPLPAQYIWHTAPESHAKVQELMFNGQPCWRAWLPSGIIEDFGCTNDSRQSYIDSNSVDVQWRWDLDLMIDRYGNQIHVHYQQNYPSSGYVRDSVISSIEYDDPTCHNTTTACSSWNPLIKIVFDASDAVPNGNLTNSGCQNWSSSSHYRCDDPLDLSGSGGLPVPKIVSTFVLNDLKVEVSGNVLHEYVFSYEQTRPTTFEDPSTGQQESYAGYLDLTAIQSLGTSGTVSNDPTVTMQYVSRTQHYEDTYQYAQPEGFTNCGASWIPRDSNGCFLWAADFSSRYISNLDNGRGWNETIGWTEARNNTHGVNSGSAVDDAFACANNTSGVCNEADDHNWSRIVVSQRTAVSNGVTSTWTYQYYMLDNLSTNSPGTHCTNCNQGYTWGNQNDDDFLDYYNGQFRSFHKVIVTLPDNSYQYHYFGSTNGWGVAESSITCYLPPGYSCSVAPYWGSETGTSGKELQEQVYDSQNNYLSLTLWTVDPTCPATVGMHSSPPGLVGPPNNPGDTQLISELDQNNPVLVCDPRVTQEDDYQIDGVTTNYQDPRVVHTTTTTAYVSGPDYGNISNVGTSGNDSSDTITSHQQFYPNDNIGGNIYLTDLPAITQTWDGSGTPYSCSQAIYGSNTNATTPPTVPGVTQEQSHTVGGTSGCSDNSNLITVQHGYDVSGNPITGIDGDGHLGCTSGSSTYSACAVYDSFATHITTAKNALNQTTSYGYD
ncbi:MAG TPA: hypothetical protein VNG51_09685, partial [Ktedonobacteraceae bacterium]|nr:hypothetical protein [Ktedonobacteraceae bacterium]